MRAFANSHLRMAPSAAATRLESSQGTPRFNFLGGLPPQRNYRLRQLIRGTGLRYRLFRQEGASPFEDARRRLLGPLSLG